MEILFADIIKAYRICRKRKTWNPELIEFEIDLFDNLYSLYLEIKEDRYTLGKSNAFIITNPTPREVFTAAFKDRIMQTYLIMRLGDIMEQKIFYKDSYACQKGKGGLQAIHAVQDLIKELSNDYTEDCYIGKLDVKSFFNNIDKEIGVQFLEDVLDKYYDGYDKETLRMLIRKIVWHYSPDDFKRINSKRLWKKLPEGKSMIGSPRHKGVPIGNINSQYLANLILTVLDYFIKYNLGIRHVRYMDDFTMVDKDLKKILKAIPEIEKLLRDTLKLKLHPDKKYIQHFSKGVKFIGGVIKPNRTYISSRTVHNFRIKMRKINRRASLEGYSIKQLEKDASTINSYLGIMCQHSSWKLRKEFVDSISKDLWKYIMVGGHFSKVIIRKKYKRRTILLNEFLAA